MKKFLVMVLVVAILASFAIVPANATTNGNYSYVKNQGLIITMNSKIDSNDITVKCGSATLNKDVDYSIDNSGDTIITFSDAFMEKTLVKNIEDIKVFDGSSECTLSYTSVADLEIGDGESFCQAETKAAFDNTTCDQYKEYLLKFFEAKKVLTITNRDDGTTVYKHGNLEVLYVDDEYAYPAEVNYYDNCFSVDITFKEAYDFFMKDMRYYIRGTLFVAFGNRMALDLSSVTPGEEYEITGSNDMKLSKYNNLIGLIGMGLFYVDETEMTEYDYQSGVPGIGELDVYSATDHTRKLFHLKMDYANFRFYITVNDQLTGENAITYKDNVYYRYDDTTIFQQRDGDYGLCSIIFSNPGIKNGDNSEWNSEDKGDITISSYAEIDDYLCVYVDGGQIPIDAYKVTEGSTVITLKEAFLSKLSAGNHSLEIVSGTGSAIAGFSTSNSIEASNKELDETDDKIVQTSDNSAIGALVAIGALSMFDLGLLKLRKKEYN